MTLFIRASTLLFITFCGAFLSAETSRVCDIAARNASQQTDVPLNVLLAISRVETGRGRGEEVESWPWTVNVSGKGYWFENRNAALLFSLTQIDSNVRSFDVGCFQINFLWHGGAFSSMDEMIDPRKNALYAARFLKRLYAEFNNWELAAGAYHSRNEKFATPYKQRFRRVYAQLDDAPRSGEVVSGRSASTGLGSLISSSYGARQTLGSLVLLPESSSSLISFE